MIIWRNNRAETAHIIPNEQVLAWLMSPRFSGHLALEMIACYGMAVGKETFDTCLWIGRFIQAWGGKDFTLIYRKDVKLHLCQSMRAKDANVRQALLDKFGGKEKAIGCKAQPGPLYGISSHLWAALAVLITYQETKAA